VKIYKAYGDKAISIVKENPYRLALDISDIGFKAADKIAQNMGIDPSSPMRAEAGVIHVLSELVDEGHIYYPYEELKEKAAELLAVSRNGRVLERRPLLQVIGQERLWISQTGICGVLPDKIQLSQLLEYYN